MDTNQIAKRINQRLLAVASERTNPASITDELYDKQRVFVEDAHHLAAFVGGVGSGKSWAGAIKARRKALARPTLGMVTAPTYNILRDATIPAFQEVAGSHIVSITNSSPINAVMSNGSRIMFRSAHNPELLRGPSISCWWGDEAALYLRDVWPIMLARLRQHGKLGYAWLTTTPKGRNWLFKTFVARGEHKHFAIFKAKTSENIFLDREYFDLLAETYVGEFSRQELDAEFVMHEGLIYSEFDRLVHTTPRVPALSTYSSVIAGVDWGYAHPGSLLIFGIDYDGRMWGLHEEYTRKRRIEEWAAVAAQLQARFNVETFYCDPSAPDFIAQFVAAGCNAVAADNTVLTGIQSVKNRLVVQGDGLPRLILSSEFVHTAGEFEAYEWMDTQGVLRDQPKKADDHGLDALRYVSMGADEAANTGMLIVSVRRVTG